VRTLLVISILAFHFLSFRNVQEATILRNSQHLANFYSELNTLATNRKGKVSILHIGDSHIQGDYFTGRVRYKLQQHFGNAGRGFVFPHNLARTYGAADVHFSSDRKWQYSSIMQCTTCDIGLAGFKVFTSEPTSLAVETPNSLFNKIELFAKADSLNIPEKASIKSQPYGYTIELEKQESSICIDPLLSHSESSQINGMVLENNQPGVLYHAVGVNGSGVNQYLRSNTIHDYLEVLKPELVILSFGTNDCYVPTSKFCGSCILEKYRKLVQRVRASNPSVSILVTTTPDHFWHGRYSNPNIEKMNSILHQLAEEERLAIWDLNKRMGGKGSIKQWQTEGLAGRDLIHFTKAGYMRLGDMFFADLLREFQRE
jgi:lysophospholipase L1-like esterase